MTRVECAFLIIIVATIGISSIFLNNYITTQKLYWRAEDRLQQQVNNMDHYLQQRDNNYNRLTTACTKLNINDIPTPACANVKTP